MATPDDILAMIRSLTGMGFRNVVFVADQLYEVKKDKLEGRPAPAVTKSVMFPVYHGNMPVAAKKLSARRESPTAARIATPTTRPSSRSSRCGAWGSS